MFKHRKKFFLTAGIGIFGILLVIATCHLLVVRNASGKIFDDIDKIPHYKVGMLLATSPITPGGARNYYFDNRISAADELYKAGKVDYIIASGGDYTQTHKYGCDEPKAIRDSLVARGVPEDVILLDYRGERTIYSVMNVRNVYGLDSVLFISQKYHNERAIYLAENEGIKAIAYNAKPSHIRRNRVKNTIREYFARVKMFIDVFKGTHHSPSNLSDEVEYNDSVYLKYNHHRRSDYSISKSHRLGRDIYRLNWYYVCCGDTLYSYEYDDFDLIIDLQTFCDSMNNLVSRNYLIEGNRHPYYGYSHNHIINILGHYVTVENREYNKDCSYDHAPHGDGVFDIYTYDISGEDFNPVKIVDEQHFDIVEGKLVDAFVRQKNLRAGGEADYEYNEWLREVAKEGVSVRNFAVGKDGLIYTYDYNSGDILPICYAEQFIIEIPYSSIHELLTPEFRKLLKEN